MFVTNTILPAFSRQCILSVAIKTKSYLDSCDSICEEENN